MGLVVGWKCAKVLQIFFQKGAGPITLSIVTVLTL